MAERIDGPVRYKRGLNQVWGGLVAFGLLILTTYIADIFSTLRSISDSFSPRDLEGILTFLSMAALSLGAWRVLVRPYAEISTEDVKIVNPLVTHTFARSRVSSMESGVYPVVVLNNGKKVRVVALETTNLELMQSMDQGSDLRVSLAPTESKHGSAGESRAITRRLTRVSKIEYVLVLSWVAYLALSLLRS